MVDVDAPNIRSVADRERFRHVIEGMVSRLAQGNATVGESEKTLVQALWDNRGTFTVAEMSEFSGWSRQTIYNKWYKYGYMNKYLKENIP